MMKVLILGVSAVQYDAVIELKKMGCETFTVAMAKDGPAADASDHFDVIDILNEKAIKEHIQKNHIDVVYSTGSDIAMPVACSISEQMNMPHFVSEEAARICNHKNELRKALVGCEANVPFRVMENIERIDLEYPVMLKPSDSQGQRGIFLINSQAEFEANFATAKSYSREGKVIVEKYIEGPEVSVNGYMVEGDLRFCVVSDRDTWKEYTGLIRRHAVPGKTISEESGRKITHLAQNICNKLGIANGPVYFQIKVADERPYLIEITPRLDGCHMWKLLEKATGINLMRLTFRHLLSNDVSDLEQWTGIIKPMELVFWCQKPGTTIDCPKLELPEDALFHYLYYNNGDVVRSVNGRYEKIGYYIRNM